MGIVKRKGGGDFSQELGRNAGPGRAEIRANTLWGLVARSPGARTGLYGGLCMRGRTHPCAGGTLEDQRGKGQGSFS